MDELINDYDAIAGVVQLYIDGGSDGDVSKLKEAFHEDARMFGHVDGHRLDIPIGQFFDFAVNQPMNSTGAYRARVASITQVGDAAQAIVAEDGCWGSVSFVDFFSLARVEGTWKIVSKTFAHTGGEIPGM